MIEHNSIEVLLVEDNPADAELTSRALKKHNLANKLYIVHDGTEALDFIYATGAYMDRDMNVLPKLILLDLKLPKVDGLEVLKRVKSDERTRIIPVVVLTSSTQEQDIIASYNLGVNSYITKPIEFNKFLSSVGELGLYWLLLNKAPV